jgi:hypothetical protein
MRTCKTCGLKHEKEDFPVSKTVGEKIYYRHKCHRCYQDTKNTRRNNLVAWYREVKKTFSCVRCGCSDWRVLEFNHIDGVKLFNVSDMLRDGCSKFAVLSEIAKCEVLCANCHRIYTFRDSYT